MINGITQFTTTQLAQNISGATTPSFTQKAIGGVADLLQRADGSSIGSALAAQINPAGQNVSVPNPSSLEAAAINPSITLSPSNSLQVTDFVNASQNAFPTSAPTPAPSAPPPAPTAPADNTGSSNFNIADSNASTNTNATPTSTTTDTTTNFSAQAASDTAAVLQSTTTGIYNAIASASASIIRGTSVDTAV